MQLLQILIIVAVCVLYRLTLNTKGRDWFILFFSICAIFWFQPLSAIRTLDYWLPVLMIGLGICSWRVISRPGDIKIKDTAITISVIGFCILLFASLQFIPILESYKYITSPKLPALFVVIVIYGAYSLLQMRWKSLSFWRLGFISIILVVLVLIKNENLSYWVSFYLRKINNQSTEIASYQDIIWIGYSYVAFRMLHTIFDSRRKNGLDVSLREYLNYLFFFPAYIAGPIDRIEHFQKELARSDYPIAEDMMVAGGRVAVGLFQKFILADTLAIISLNEQLANQITSGGWMWFVVVMYAFRIYFDFSGYSHIAIGISKMIGLNLPENFNRPLQAPTLTMFWNSWHMTLTQWFRGYYFNPISRWIRKKKVHISPMIIMGFMQVSTMVLIGLWHGINLNFVIWGLWNGIGLFIQNNVSGYLTRKFGSGKPLWQKSKMYKAFAIIFTFIFISLGWVWFAMPNTTYSIKVFKTIFGLS